MALLSVSRRRHFREHISIREICRRSGLSRNTIQSGFHGESRSASPSKRGTRSKDIRLCSRDDKLPNVDSFHSFSATHQKPSTVDKLGAG
ncbi:hypothetical protein CKA34_27250 (plasmid) [Rhizobium sp. 11515TR]|nr:hypothetical protein CKA34_27250 [Rhizobium sp. 11515TR]